MFLFIVSLFIILATAFKAIFSVKRDRNAKLYMAIDKVLLGISLLYFICVCYFLIKEEHVNYAFAGAIGIFVCFANAFSFSDNTEKNISKQGRFLSLVFCGFSIIFLVIYCIFGGTLVIEPESKVQDVQYITAINDDYVVLSTISTYYYKKIGVFGNEKPLKRIAKEEVNINAEKEKVINAELLVK